MQSKNRHKRESIQAWTTVIRLGENSLMDFIRTHIVREVVRRLSKAVRYSGLLSIIRRAAAYLCSNSFKILPSNCLLELQALSIWISAGVRRSSKATWLISSSSELVRY